jgi:Uma2 family endonuclease
MSTITAPITAAQFIEMDEPEGRKIELIGGELIDMPRGGYPHETVKGNLIEILGAWTHQYREFALRSETAFQLEEQNCLIPDVSLIARNRLVPGTQGIMQGSPELAIEVVSSETAERLVEKITLYIEHGSRAVWVAYPALRVVHVYDRTRTSRLLTEADALEDPVLLQGFSTPFAAIFECV